MCGVHLLPCSTLLHCPPVDILWVKKRQKKPGSPKHLSVQVPNNRNVKVRFNLFYLVDPNVPLGTCPKDYVEINGER